LVHGKLGSLSKPWVAQQYRNHVDLSPTGGVNNVWYSEGFGPSSAGIGAGGLILLESRVASAGIGAAKPRCIVHPL